MYIIENPKTKEEHHHNIKVQYDNINDHMNKKDYEAALYSAKFLIKKLENIVKIKV